MLLCLREALKRKGTTEAEFFDLAHTHAYGCRDSSNIDLIQFKLHGIVPLYVREYAAYVLESS